MVGIVGVSSYFIYQVWAAAEQSFDPLNRDKSAKRDKEITMEDPFTVLLVGTDVRTADAKDWRSDVLMVAAVNPKKINQDAEYPQGYICFDLQFQRGEDQD